MQEGQSQWLIDVICFPQYATPDIVDNEYLQRGEMHKPQVKWTVYKSTIITSLWTYVPLFLGEPKAGRDIVYPLLELKTIDIWGTQYNLNVVVNLVNVRTHAVTRLVTRMYVR